MDGYGLWVAFWMLPSLRSHLTLKLEFSCGVVRFPTRLIHLRKNR